jgi:hypothetical protein
MRLKTPRVWKKKRPKEIVVRIRRVFFSKKDWKEKLEILFSSSQ